MTPARFTAMLRPVDDVVVAIADPTRWRLLNMLAQRGQGTATTLAAELPVSRPAVAKHLAVLGRAGLVRSRRAGREVWFRLRPERIAETSRWMARLATEWDVRLATIKTMAEGSPRSA